LLNSSLKSVPSLGGGKNNFPFLINGVQALISFRFAGLRILSCFRPQSTVLSFGFWNDGFTGNWSEQKNDEWRLAGEKNYKTIDDFSSDKTG
jgi:hypothetical protein